MKFTNENLDLSLRSLVETLSDIRSKLLYKIILETACKTSELSNIKLRDIKKNKIIFKDRTVKISNELYKLISEYKKTKESSKSPFLFSTRQSDSISPKRIRQIIHATSKQILGEEIDPKDIRKYAIQNKLKEKPVEDVRKEVGLKSLDKRKYLSPEQISKLKNNIKDKRTALIFKLLLNNIKSSKIVNFKVEDFLGTNLPEELNKELEEYAIQNRVSFGEYLFKTRQGTHLSKVTIFKIIKKLGEKANIEINPQILTNTSHALATFSENPEQELKKLGIKTRAFHIQGGFIKNE